MLFLAIMILVTLAVREVLIKQFSAQYQQGVAATLQAIQKDLFSRRTAVAQQLRQLAAKLKEDYEFRLYTVLLQEYQQAYVIDYAQNYMAAMGLQALEIADANGLVLSSGHYRNAFGNRKRALIQGLQTTGEQPVLAWFQRDRGAFLCLTTLDSARLGARKFYLIGGVEISAPFLRQFQRDTTEVLILQLEDGVVSSAPQWDERFQASRLDSGQKVSAGWMDVEDEYSTGSFKLPFITGGAVSEAAIFFLHPKIGLARLLHGINERLFVIMGIGILIAVAISIWRALAIARPLRRLAAAAGALSLDRPEAQFNVKGHDEVGILSDAMSEMIQRLRDNHTELIQAEQKAAFAEVARQVNHDIKNGLVPIRHVMQHWMEVAELEPEKLLEIFKERTTTVLESVDYLDNLARSVRLRPSPARAAVNVNQLMQDLLKNYQDLPEGRIRFQTPLDSRALCVPGDAVQLRRAFENVLQNALAALGEEGVISIAVEPRNGQVLVIWKDSGAGIPDHIQRRLFHAPITTKAEGTGLGLINVKHIVENFGGTVTIESEVGRGTTICLALPQINSELKKVFDGNSSRR